MTEPLRRTMNYTGGRCKSALTAFGFSVLVRLTAPQESWRGRQNARTLIQNAVE